MTHESGLNNHPSRRSRSLDIALLVGASALLALINRQPVIDHWVFNAVDLVRDKTITTAFDPLYIPEAIAYAIRPLSFILLKYYFAAFGLAIAPNVVATFLKLALFAVATYLFFSILAHRAVAFAVAVISVSLPAAIYSSSLICENDILGSAFIFFSGYFLVRRLKDGGGEAPTNADIVIGLIFALLALLTKETIALIMGIFLFSLTVVTIGERSTRWRFMAATAVYGLVFAAVFHAFTTTPPYMARFAPSFAHVAFVIRHNIDQLVAFVPLFAVAVMVPTALAALVPAHAKSLAVVGIVAGCAAFFSPVIVTYRFYEALYFSPVGLFFAAGLLVIAVFILRLVAHDTISRLLSLTLLGAVALGIAFPVVSNHLRDDMSARVYLPLAPVLAYVAIDAILTLAGSTGQWALLFFVPLIYFYGANTFNFASEFRARTDAEYGAKKAISTMNIGGSTVLSNNFDNWFTPHDAYMLGGARVDFDHALVAAVQAHGRVPADPAKIGRPGKKFFLYLTPRVRFGDAIDDRVRTILMGDFAWANYDSYSFLAVDTSPYPGAGLGVIDIEKGTVYRRQTWLKDDLADHATKLFGRRDRFYRLPAYPDDIVMRLAKGIPLIIPYDYLGEVYRIGK